MYAPLHPDAHAEVRQQQFTLDLCPGCVACPHVQAAQRALQQATSLLYKCEKLVSPAMAQYRLDTAKQYGFPSIVPPFKQPLARMPAQFIALSYGYMTGPHVDGVTSLPAQPGE